MIKLLNLLRKFYQNLKTLNFFFSGILDKKSKLRNFFEKSNNCGIVPCYQDNEITIKKIIQEKLKGYEGLKTKTINLIIRK